MQNAVNLGETFSLIAKQYSSYPAIKLGNTSYTYQQLDIDSASLASFLSTEGLKQGDVIAIINSKQYISFALILACIKIGVIYTNIDPDIPANWLQGVFDTCKPKKVFADRPITENIIHSKCLYEKKIESSKRLIRLIKSSNKIVNFKPQRISGTSIAYIMFTSGSTGKPKGVAITHQALINFIRWSVTRYKVSPNDIFANVSPMYFDNSVFDFYTALFSGACIAPICKEIVTSPKRLIDYVDNIGCTIWFSVPSLLMYLMTTKVLNTTSFKQIRILTFGGEGYPKSELKKLYGLYKHRIEFINVYGPTECTCICSSYTLSDHDFENCDGFPALGYINQNVSYLILNDKNQTDKKGELCLLGPNLALGYYNNSETTNHSFLYYTGNGYYQAKMYRTGDLVYEKEGILYFIGRKDNQIKHMGHRIELEGIESAIRKINSVNEAAVIYHREEKTYGKIIAFIATLDNNLSPNSVKKYLANKLPIYMIPHRFIFLDHLPKNANGKIDRVQLLGGVKHQHAASLHNNF